MIEVVTGRIGGGKTCMAIYRMCKYMASGGAVYTNIRLKGVIESFDIETRKPVFSFSRDAPIIGFLRSRYKWEYQEGQYNIICPDDMEIGFQSVVPPGIPEKKVLVVIDEVNEWFDSLDRDKVRTDKAYRLTLRFLRQSRKVYIDVIFILQDFSTLNNRIRGLVGFVWVCRDMQYFNVVGVPMGFIFKRYFVWYKYDGSGRFPQGKPRWVVKDFELFGVYDTTEIFGDTLGIAPAGSKIVDFRGKGLVKKVGDKMNNFQFACLGLCCACSVASLVFILSGDDKSSGVCGGVVYVTNTVSNVAVDNRPKAKNVFWAPIAYGRAGDFEWCYVAGRMYRKGMMCEYGRVVEIDKYHVRVVGDFGDVYFLHSEINELEKKAVINE